MIVVPLPPADTFLPRYDGDNITATPALGVLRYNNYCFWSPSGDDQLFTTTLLKNGWKVYSPPTVTDVHGFNGGGGAYLAGSRIGTNSPYVDVHWWVNVGFFCSSDYGYGVTIPIEGPLGTPDGVVVK
jgi:hypothetical protein